MIILSKGSTPLIKLALALFVVIITTSLSINAFDSNKLYKYDFQGAITNKIADDDKPQYSGFSIKSTILIRKNGDELTIKLDQPQLATFNDVINDIHLYQYDYMQIDSSTNLDKPFRVYFNDNEAKSLDIHKDEPRWVSNFKRGLISFFQLKGLNNNNNNNNDKKDSDFITTNEKSIFGDCPTDYIILEGENVLNVTKTRDLSKCKSRYLNRFIPIETSECFDNEKDLQQFKHSNAIFNFNLIGNKENYIIDRAILDELSIFSPFSQKAHSHSIHTKFMILLNKIIDYDNSLNSIPDGSIKNDKLVYEPAETIDFYNSNSLEKEHHLSDIFELKANVEQVMETFDNLVKEHKTYSASLDGQSLNNNNNNNQLNFQENSHLALLFLKLNQLIGSLNYQQIEQVYTQVDDRGDSHKKIFWDLMSVVGTNPSFMFMKKLITDGEAPSVKIKEFLTRLSFHIKSPSKNLFDEYNNLCKTDKIQTNQQYKRLCLLPLASLIHQHCVKPSAKLIRLNESAGENGSPSPSPSAATSQLASTSCQLATADEYFNRLIQADNSELSISEQMFNIKMVGELGVKQGIDYLNQIIRNKLKHPTIRSAAMWNLIKTSRIYPTKVKSLVIPYYYDQNELLELRIAAFYCWLNAGISLHEMETIGLQLMIEQNRQLVLYISSLIDSMSKLKSFPCSKSMEKNAKLILPIVKRALKYHSHGSMWDSRVSMSNTWNDDFNYGTASIMSTIFSNDSLAPANIFYKSSEIMSGIKLNPMMLSIQAHGLDKLIKRVIGINGLLADKESFMDVFSLKKRAKRETNNMESIIKEELLNIDKELKINVREFNDIYIAATITAYGRPITFFDIDSKELKKMMSDDGTIKIPQIKKLLHSFNNHSSPHMLINFEKLELFNNELGLPLYQAINDFEYKNFKLNSVKIDVEPGFFKDERQGKPPTRLTAALDMKFSRHNEMFITSGSILVNNKEKIGVGFHKKKLLNIPIKLSIDANLLENKVSFKEQAIQENILYIKQTPMTFIHSYNPQDNNEQKNKILPLYNINNTNHMKGFKLDYVTPLALGLKMEGKHKVGQDWSMSAWRRYMNDLGLTNAKFMYFYSPTGSPLELRLSTFTTEENPTKELTATFSWKHHHENELTSSNDLNQAEKELESYTSKSGNGGKPTTVNYQINLLGGSVKERKVGIDISYSRSFDRLLHKWRVFYQRTPLDVSSMSSEVTNLCWNGQMQFPKYNVDKLLKFDLLDMNHSTNMTSDLTFGDKCTDNELEQAPSKVSMKITADWSQEQRKMIEAALNVNNNQDDLIKLTIEQENGKRNNYLDMYKKCLKDRLRSGATFEASCVHLLHKMSELLDIKSVIDYKDVPDRWIKMMKKIGSLYTYARAGYIEEIDDKASSSSSYYDLKASGAAATTTTNDGKQGRANLQANITNSNFNERSISYEFNTPNYHVLYKNLPLSIPPLSTFPLLDSSYYQMLQQRFSSRYCSVSGQQVTTFDNLTYTMPSIEDNCYKLITKDCSPENNFAILGAKVGLGKAIKIYIGQKYKVEFLPEGKRVSEIKVNGEKVTIEEEKSPLVRETKLGSKVYEAFSIENTGAYYTIRSKLYKFSLTTDGSWMFIRQSKYYAGKACGICGDSNGNQQLELKSPVSSKRVCKNTNDFVWSYVIPSTCPSKPANSNECNN